MDTMASDKQSSGPTDSRTKAATFWSRLRRLWMEGRHPEAACVLRGHAFGRRLPVARLEAATQPDAGGAVLLIDHAHPDAIRTLQTLHATHPKAFDEGRVVVGVERLPAGQADLLSTYRRHARAPVFAVDLGRAGDRMLLREALLVAPVAAALYRQAAARVSAFVR
jgi:hypothetical protein